LSIGSSISKYSKYTTGLIGFSHNFGIILGEIFWVFSLITAAYETIAGAIKGWKEAGFLGAIKGAISGLWNSLIGDFLSLLNSLVSYTIKWLGNALGFNFPQDFSISEMMYKAIGRIKDWFLSFFDFALPSVSDLLVLYGIGQRDGFHLLVIVIQLLILMILLVELILMTLILLI
jgi:hypothetical protein